MSNESIIRQKIIDKYNIEFPQCSIKEEFTTACLNTRNDVMVIDEYIISIEIKSDRDVLKRLVSQVTEYATYSSLVVIALDTKHIKSFYKNYSHLLTSVDSSVTLIEFKDDNLIELVKGNPIPQPSVLNLLWSDELYLLRPKLPRKKKGSQRNNIYKDSSKYASIKILKDIYTESELKQLAYSMFANRFKIINKQFEYCPELIEESSILVENKLESYINYLSR